MNKKRNMSAKIPIYENISCPPDFLFLKHGYSFHTLQVKVNYKSQEIFLNRGFPKPTSSNNRKQPFGTHGRLHNEAFALASLLRFGPQDGTNRLIEDLLQSPLCQRRAFHIFHSSYFVGQLLALFSLDGAQALIRQGIESLSIVS